MNEDENKECDSFDRDSFSDTSILCIGEIKDKIRNEISYISISDTTEDSDGNSSSDTSILSTDEDEVGLIDKTNDSTSDTSLWETSDVSDIIKDDSSSDTNITSSDEDCNETSDEKDDSNINDTDEGVSYEESDNSSITYDSLSGESDENLDSSRCNNSSINLTSDDSYCEQKNKSNDEKRDQIYKETGNYRKFCIKYERKKSKNDADTSMERDMNETSLEENDIEDKKSNIKFCGKRNYTSIEKCFENMKLSDFSNSDESSEDTDEDSDGVGEDDSDKSSENDSEEEIDSSEDEYENSYREEENDENEYDSDLLDSMSSSENDLSIKTNHVQSLKNIRSKVNIIRFITHAKKLRMKNKLSVRGTNYSS